LRYNTPKAGVEEGKEEREEGKLTMNEENKLRERRRYV
jgi:hypothetical protein